MSVAERSSASPPKKKKRQRQYNWTTPRFWHGMRFTPWVRLLVRHRFRVSPTRVPMAFMVTLFSVLNSLLHYVQNWLYGRQADAIEIRQPPLFVIGHWRSGTTMLHELMVLDPRHNSPTTYECFAPSHFLLTSRIVTKWFSWILPSQRPMDNMAAGWRKPQEDEFALCNLGTPSPYLTMAFPNDPPAYPEYLDLRSLSSEQREQWKASLRWFLQRLTWQDPRRIVLKSPPHTARVRTLLEMFPDAQFIHIVRDPYEVYASTDRLWKSLNGMQGCQTLRNPDYEEYIFDALGRMYRAFEEDRHLLRRNQLFEVRYEDLVQNPTEQMQALYEHLELGNFENVLPGLRRYLDAVRDHRTRTTKDGLSPELKAKIADQWRPFFGRHGYPFE